MIISRSIHVAENDIISFFLWLSNIPFYIYIYIFTHSSVDGHSGCFHVFTTVNSAAMNTGMPRYLLELQLSPDKCLGMRFLDHMVLFILA